MKPLSMKQKKSLCQSLEISKKQLLTSMKNYYGENKSRIVGH